MNRGSPGHRFAVGAVSAAMSVAMFVAVPDRASAATPTDLLPSITLPVPFGLFQLKRLHECELAPDEDHSGEDLSHCDLDDVSISKMDLREADLTGSSLRRVRGFDTSLAGAVLFKADMREADLTAADLRDADLRRADLRGAKVSGVRCEGARLERTRLPDDWPCPS